MTYPLLAGHFRSEQTAWSGPKALARSSQPRSSVSHLNFPEPQFPPPYSMSWSGWALKPLPTLRFKSVILILHSLAIMRGTLSKGPQSWWWLYWVPKRELFPTFCSLWIKCPVTPFLRNHFAHQFVHLYLWTPSNTPPWWQSPCLTSWSGRPVEAGLHHLYFMDINLQ